MLNHYIIVPPTSPYLFKSDLMMNLVQLNVKLISYNNYCLNRVSETSVSSFGNERVLYSTIEFKEFIALNQLRYINFNNINSIHLIGSLEQLEFLCKILDIFELNINLFFSDDKNNTKSILENISNRHNIIYIDSKLLDNSVEYEKFIISNLNIVSDKKHISYLYKSNCILIPSDQCTTSLYVNNIKIIETIFELNKSINQNSNINNKSINNSNSGSKFTRKIRKLRQNPKLFFKDMINKYRRLI